MAKQTFTSGQVLTAAQMTSLQQTAMLGGDASAKTSSYTLVAADAGTAISMSNAGATTITVNTGLFAAGDIVTIVNLGAGVCTITAGTATVATSGSLALAQNQGGVLRFTSASAAIFFQFATPASGDIEGVTAGTGISGGGTSGTVTITNSMATAIDAKGDLVAGTGADTFARLAVGADGTTLVADSSQSTGLKWATAAAGGKLLQVVSSTTTTPITISTTTLTDTGITATITPTASTSKILVLLTYCIDFAVANVRDMESKGRLLRGATTIADYNNNLFAMQITNASTTTGYFIQEGQNSISYLDNPATTSATTYKFQAAPENTVSGRSIRFQTDNGPSTITLFEIGA